MLWPELCGLLQSLREENLSSKADESFPATKEDANSQSDDSSLHQGNLLRKLNDRREEERTGREPIFDLKRCQIISRLYELLGEQCNPRIGVLQSDVCNIFTKTHFHSASVFFYTSDEINEGCVTGPSLPLFTVSSEGYSDAMDCRLCVTEEIFEQMLTEMTNLELAQVLDAFTDYVHVADTAWQASPVERTEYDRDAGVIRNASGLATHECYAYVADSRAHAIFRIHMFTEQVELFVGRLNSPGFRDGPREMAQFNCPSGICLDEKTSTLYVADTKNDCIRAVGVTSGLVQTLGLASVDYIGLVAPVGVCVVYGDYEYDDDENASDEDDARPIVDTDEEDDEAPDRACALEGIVEEDEDQFVSEDADGSPPFPLDDDGSGMLGSEWWDEVVARRRLVEMRRRSARFSLADDSAFSRNSSVRTSRRTSRAMTGPSSINTTRQPSFSWASSSAIESLKECTEEQGFGLNLAVACDHSVFLVKPHKSELKLVAGSISEYGYKDSAKGTEARFSSLKGLTCIRNSIFVADHWNNVIRCVNLKTTQVDTVIDFEPNGPMALTVTKSGNLYVLDSETVQYCNVLRICSMHVDKPTEGVLGTLSFRALQRQIAETRSGLSSLASSRRSSCASGVGDVGGGYNYNRRRSSAESTGSRRASDVDLTFKSRRRSSSGAQPKIKYQPARGSITELRRSFGGDPTERIYTSGDSNRLSAPKPASSQRHSHSNTPEIPAALRSLVPGASLHPALSRMLSHSRQGSVAAGGSAVGMVGSQFRVSVASSVSADEEEGPQFQSHLTPKEESPWNTLPICSLQYIFQENSGQCYPNTPLSLCFWDHADLEMDHHLDVPWRQLNVLLIGLTEWPWLIKFTPPMKPPPAEAGRFRAVSVDLHRCLVADQESNQIFAIHHTKNTKDKVAGCGKEGWLDGPLDVCRMNRPSAICLDPTTHFIYVADKGNHRIRCIDLSTGFMSTVCGNGSKGCQDSVNMSHQSLDSPFELDFIPPHHLLISCADNSVRKFDIRSSSLETVLIGS